MLDTLSHILTLLGNASPPVLVIIILYLASKTNRVHQEVQDLSMNHLGEVLTALGRIEAQMKQSNDHLLWIRSRVALLPFQGSKEAHHSSDRDTIG